MVTPLLHLGVIRLLIESREGRDELDRQVLIEELRRRGAELTYEHLLQHSDPLLWIADALAWCSSAGGSWRDRIAPITTGEEIVGL